MKIGILTLPLFDNYGGILQAIALYKFLHNQGHEVVLLNKDTHKVIWKKIIIAILLKIPFHNFKNLKSNDKTEKKLQKRREYHRGFIEKELFSISHNLYTKQDLEDYVNKENFDAIIVGSDQVWRKEYLYDKYYKSYFLDFVDRRKTKKIAYAASFGKDHWEGTDDIDDISELLKDFSAISTRESSGIDICRDSFRYFDAKHALDPTLLMGKEFYLDEIILKYDVANIIHGGLVTYVLDEAQEKKTVIDFISKSQNINNVCHLKGFNSSKTMYSVPQWLAAIAYADFVVTDSFHAMVFSIIFEKNFLVIGNYNRGLARFTSLLSLLGLDDRLIFNENDLNDRTMIDIDYVTVNKKLAENQAISVNFLMHSLNNVN
jgi:hypothetical protein